MDAEEVNVLAPPEIRSLDLTGRDRQLRSAVLAMERIALGFARSARRSLPFLTRYRTRIVPTAVALLPPMLGQSGPTFTIQIAGPDGVARGAVTFDAQAIGVTLEGALGGGYLDSPVALAADLSPAQRALMTRIGRSLAVDLAAAIQSEVGLQMSPMPLDPSQNTQDPPTDETLYVACELEGLPIQASITLQVSAESLEAAVRHQDPEAPGNVDPRVAEAMLDVPVEVVAELGRVTLGIGAILKLQPGDIIRLPTATDDAVRVYMSGIHKFDGVPIASRGQLAIEIRSRNTD